MPRTSLVSDWMSQEVVSIAADRSVLDAILLMRKNRVRLLPVTSGTLLLGIISDRDLRNPTKSLHDLKLADLYRNEGDIQIEHIMTNPVMTITPHDHIATAANLIISNQIGGLPVIEKKGSDHVVGIITTTDLLKAFLHLMDISNI